MTKDYYQTLCLYEYAAEKAVATARDIQMKAYNKRRVLEEGEVLDEEEEAKDFAYSLLQTALDEAIDWLFDYIEDIKDCKSTWEKAMEYRDTLDKEQDV